MQARAAAERSDLIITVSAFTARQVEQLLDVEPSRIRVIHHGVRPAPSYASPIPRQQIILSVGAIQRRKNTVRLVEAFEQTDPGWKLVLAGSSGFDSQDALQRIERSPRKQDIQVLGYVARPRPRRTLPARGDLRVPVVGRGLRDAGARRHGARRSGFDIECLGDA